MQYADSQQYPVESHRYGAEPEQVADLRLPSGGGPFPVIVSLHGGYFAAQWTRRLNDALCIALTRSGFVTWNVEYRRTGSGGNAELSSSDVAAAIDHLLELRVPLDPTRVTVMGHSAGGYLALRCASLRAITHVIALAPVCDLAESVRAGSDRGRIVAYMGGTPDERPEAYAAAGLSHRIAQMKDITVVHGLDDHFVPIAQSTEFVASARAASVSVDYFELASVGHFALIDPRGSVWPLVALTASCR
jgi:acetyl esterase/lipase